MAFDPQEFDKFKAAQAAPAPNNYDPMEFQKYKDHVDGITPPQKPVTVMDLARKAISKIPGGVGSDILNTVDASKGIVRGFKGDKSQPANTAESIGRNVGRYGPATAGMGIATLLSGGTAPLVAVGAAGLGGASGEAYRQLGSRMLGGNSPSTPEEAIKHMSKEALDAIFAETGVRLGIKGVQVLNKMAPDLAFSLLKMPAESVRRVIQRMSKGIDIIPKGGADAAEKVGMEAIEHFRNIQKSVGVARAEAGRKVGDALELLQKDTRGAKIFDVGTVSKNMRTLMSQQYQAADPTIQAIAKRDLDRIGTILDSLEKEPFRDATSVNRIKQEVQGLSDFADKGVPEVTSDLGQNIVKDLGRSIRVMIDDTAKNSFWTHKPASTALQKANAEAKVVYDYYDSVRPMLATSRTDTWTLSNKVNHVRSIYNSDAVKRALIKDIGKTFPGATPHLEKFLDSIAAHAFADSASYAGGHTVGAFVRTLLSPENVGKMIKASAGSGIPMKMLTRTATMMAHPTPQAAVDKGVNKVGDIFSQ